MIQDRDAFVARHAPAPEPERISRRTPLRRYWGLVLALCGATLGLFAVTTWAGLEPAHLLDQSPRAHGSLTAAVVSVLLLVSDVVLPVPASVVMTLNGRLFGTLGGTALSVAGGVASTLVGVLFGRAGAAAVRQWVGPAEYARASDLLERWGVFAVVLTRPIPVLAETVAVLAGTSTLTWGRVALASAVGVLPAGWAYAAAGAARLSGVSQALVFGSVLVLAGGCWWLGRLPRTAQTPGASSRASTPR